jgi:hypothetical protein
MPRSRSDGMPTNAPMSAAPSPLSSTTAGNGMPSRTPHSAATPAPIAMNAALPMETRPATPVSRFSASAPGIATRVASAMLKYSVLAKNGNAATTMTRPSSRIREARLGRSAASCV